MNRLQSLFLNQSLICWHHIFIGLVSMEYITIYYFIIIIYLKKYFKKYFVEAVIRD